MMNIPSSPLVEEIFQNFEPLFDRLPKWKQRKHGFMISLCMSLPVPYSWRIDLASRYFFDYMFEDLLKERMR